MNRFSLWANLLVSQVPNLIRMDTSNLMILTDICKGPSLEGDGNFTSVKSHFKSKSRNQSCEALIENQYILFHFLTD